MSAESPEVTMMCCLQRLIVEWKDNPDRLAVVVTAYGLAGYTYPHWDLHGLTDTEALDLINSALYRKRRERLRQRAQGLLLAIEALGPDAEAHRLHEIQVGAAVIECRTLDLDERIERLRAMDGQAA